MLRSCSAHQLEKFDIPCHLCVLEQCQNMCKYVCFAHWRPGGGYWSLLFLMKGIWSFEMFILTFDPEVGSSLQFRGTKGISPLDTPDNREWEWEWEEKTVISHHMMIWTRFISYIQQVPWVSFILIASFHNITAAEIRFVKYGTSIKRPERLNFGL